MYLLIDMSEQDKIHLAVFDKIQIEHKYYTGRNRKLLVCIDKLLKSSPLGKGGAARLPARQGGLLSGIMVAVGTGSFTSTRVACVVANTFAYTLQIPLLAIKKEEIVKVQKLIKKFEACPAKPGGRRRGQYLSATYSGEPNLGPAKK
ncbi:MAG: Peptidase M22 glycoprotease [Candidatus Magasanikbacteria bacterium GW2011_GWC2_37_14]|uniref:Peptidase M22 glycoprotease n=1 Tax=Candidatus Magasanikbacteria bacterium GW2011_GWC2_37_14 TaxID=1619046 RepID=A0A0G0IU80_9BACT|nr:MAG: Peptidase M22 glycoprotease [Candidatus Magasanikbacteria bacterium GW2011_GWC2_37_14]